MLSFVKSYLKSTFFILPSSKSLSYNWNYGSMLAFILSVQLLSGLFLVFYYNSCDGYGSVQYMMYEVCYGWFFRCLHFNGASLFFFFMYCHLFKGLFLGGFRLFKVWSVGVVMLFLFMGVAFMGYVLVFSQMSLWAAIVITSLLTSFPFFGELMVFWVWGGYSVYFNTVKFFFCFHFLLPWLGLLFVILHLVFLHDTGSSSFLFCHGDYDKIMFYPDFWLKDFLNLGWLVFFICVFFIFPFLLGEYEMFSESNVLVSPAHIVPEWYFLFAYAILRAIPNKIIGTLFLFFSIGVLFILGFVKKDVVFFNLNKVLVFLVLLVVIFLSWLGFCVPEFPFDYMSGIFTFFYFVLFVLIFFSFNLSCYWLSMISMMNM